MKRWTLRIALCLIVGAVTTVGVAWGCVLNPWWRASQKRLPLDLASEMRWWSAVAPADMPRPDSAGRLHRPGVDCDNLRAGWKRPSDHWAQAMEEVLRTRAGLPLRSLEGAVFIFVAPPNDVTTIVSYWSIKPPRALIEDRIIAQRTRLPLRPLWPGFFIDTLFYAAIWFGIFFGFGSARSALRRRRGRCSKCGYDVRGEFESGCSECGWNRSEPRP